jgi:hypothetical protein
MTTTAAPTWMPSIDGIAYTVRPLADDRQAWRVARADGKGAYVVRREPGGRWECSCPAFQYGTVDRKAGCKHIGLIQAMAEAVGLPLDRRENPCSAT